MHKYFHNTKSDLDYKLPSTPTEANVLSFACVWHKKILHLFTQISKCVPSQCDLFNNAKLTKPQDIDVELNIGFQFTEARLLTLQVKHPNHLSAHFDIA